MSWYVDTWKKGWNTLFGSTPVQPPEKPNLVDLSTEWLFISGGKKDDMQGFTNFINREMTEYNVEVERYNAAVASGVGDNTLVYVGIALVILLLFDS